MILLARLMHGTRGYVRSLRNFLLRLHDRSRSETCRLSYEKWPISPGTSCRPEVAGVLRPALADVADEMIEAVADCPGVLRGRSTAPFGDGRPRTASRRRCVTSWPRSKPAGAVARPRCLLGSRAGRDASRAQPRVAAQRLPDRRPGGVAAVRRDRRRRPGSNPTRCICWRSRCSPTSTCSHPNPPRVTRWSSRRSRARPSCAAAGWCGCWSATPRPSRRAVGRRPPRPAGRCRAALAVLAIAGRGAIGAASRLPDGAITETIGDLRARCISDPDGPGRRAAIERAVRRRGGPRRSRHDRRLEPGADQLRPGAGGAGASGAGPGLVAAREQAGRLLLRSDPGLAGELAARPAGAAAAGSRRDRATV